MIYRPPDPKHDDLHQQAPVRKNGKLMRDLAGCAIQSALALFFGRE